MKHLLLVLFIAAATCPVSADSVTALASLAVTGPLRALTGTFMRETPHQVTLEFDTSPNIARRLAAGEAPDVLVGTTAAVDQAIREGKAIAATRTLVGRMGVGVAVGREGPRPDIGTVEAFEASLLEADAVLYSRGASGVYVDRMLQDLGLAERLKTKIVRLPTGGDVAARLGENRGNEIGFTMVSELLESQERHAMTLVGPLPEAVQHYTVYEAVVMGASGAADAARAFVRSLTTPAAQKVLAGNGWQF